MAAPQAEILEYVYHPETAPEDFQTVKLTLQFSEDEGKLMVNLDAEIEMTEFDVKDILLYLEKSKLRHRKISILDDCVIVLKSPEQNVKVQLEKSWAIKPFKA